jgi:hypothetical protein
MKELEIKQIGLQLNVERGDMKYYTKFLNKCNLGGEIYLYVQFRQSEFLQAGISFGECENSEYDFENEEIYTVLPEDTTVNELKQLILRLEQK